MIFGPILPILSVLGYWAIILDILDRGTLDVEAFKHSERGPSAWDDDSEIHFV